MPDVPALLVPLLVRLEDLDPQPSPADVKAGYPALFLFLGLLVVVGLLGWSLSRHLRRAETNQRAGLFGDVPQQPGDEAVTTPGTDGVVADDGATATPGRGDDRPAGGTAGASTDPRPPA